jgi:site-specific DNA-adenine methylase
MDKIIASPITTNGGKYASIKEYHLDEYIPTLSDNHYVYVELFCGSGVVFLNVAHKIVSCILNDDNYDIWNFFDIITSKSLYPIFQSKLDTIYIGKAWFDSFDSENIDLTTKLTPDETKLLLKTIQNILNPSIHYSLINNSETNQTLTNIADILHRSLSEQEKRINRAIAFYVKNKINFKGIVKNKNWYNSAKPKPFNKDLALYHEIFNSVKYMNIWNLDFREALKRLNHHETKDRDKYFIFIDPPYPDTVGYNSIFDKQAQLDLFELLKNCPHTFLMTHKNDPFIVDLYKDFFQTEIEVNYFSKLGSEKGKEILISNNPIKRNNRSIQKTLIEKGEPREKTNNH